MDAQTKIFEEDMNKIEYLSVIGEVESLCGLEYAKSLCDLYCEGGRIADLSPIVKTVNPNFIRPIRIHLVNNQKKEVEFLEAIPEDSGISVYLSGIGLTAEEAFEKYCGYDVVNVRVNSGNQVIYGKCELPWLFFENDTIKFVSTQCHLARCSILCSVI